MWQAVDGYFKITERGSTGRREVVAGLATFMTMAYILIVNPAWMAAAGMDASGRLDERGDRGGAEQGSHDGAQRVNHEGPENSRQVAVFVQQAGLLGYADDRAQGGEEVADEESKDERDIGDLHGA